MLSLFPKALHGIYTVWTSRRNSLSDSQCEQVKLNFEVVDHQQQLSTVLSKITALKNNPATFLVVERHHGIMKKSILVIHNQIVLPLLIYKSANSSKFIIFLGVSTFLCNSCKYFGNKLEKSEFNRRFMSCLHFDP